VSERKPAAAAGNGKARTGGRGGDTPQVPGVDETGHFVVQPGSMIDTSAPFPKGRYKILKQLGSGTYGKVVLCEDAKYQGALVAVKLVRNTPHLYRIAALNEIKVLRELDGRNCTVKILRDFEHRFGLQAPREIPYHPRNNGP